MNFSHWEKLRAELPVNPSEAATEAWTAASRTGRTRAPAARGSVLLSKKLLLKLGGHKLWLTFKNTFLISIAEKSVTISLNRKLHIHKQPFFPDRGTSQRIAILGGISLR